MLTPQGVEMAKIDDLAAVRELFATDSQTKIDKAQRQEVWARQRIPGMLGRARPKERAANQRVRSRQES
jgi:hypothetical protein